MNGIGGEISHYHASGQCTCDRRSHSITRPYRAPSRGSESEASVAENFVGHSKCILWMRPPLILVGHARENERLAIRSAKAEELGGCMFRPPARIGTGTPVDPAEVKVVFHEVNLGHSYVST